MAEMNLNTNQGEIRYLTPLDISTKNRKKYCRFKRLGIKYIDYKDPDYLLKFINEQGKILPRRLTGTSLKFQRKVVGGGGSRTPFSHTVNKEFLRFS